MIPTVTKKGTSFKGAALYYLHDKNALTNDRIEFTQTQNLATDNPEMAWKMMAYTAMHQSEIKQAAGGVAKGRKLTQPVFAYSLAWHPTQEPTREQMVEAGLKTLKVLGLHEHEAILVAHNDADHKHVHLIVNRVHPETGVAAKLSNDRLKLSKWAENYERDHGKIFCDQRVENNKRRKNEYIKHRENLSKAEFYRWQREKVKQAHEKRQQDGKNLSQIHKKQRDRLFNAKERLIEERHKQIKESNRPKWASIYKRQNKENLKLKEIQGSALSRVAYYIKTRHQERKTGSSSDKQGLLAGAFSAVTDRDKLTKSQVTKHEQERKIFAGKIAEQARNALKEINNKYAHNLEKLKANQTKESDLMKTRHSIESQKLAKDITSGKTEKEFDRIKRAQALRDEYNKKSYGKPTDLKSEFNEKVDFRVARYMKEEREREKAVHLKGEFNKKKGIPPDIQKDFRVARYMKEEEERKKADTLKKDQGIDKKDDRISRYVNDNRQDEKKENHEKDQERSTNRDMDMERDI